MNVLIVSNGDIGDLEYLKRLVPAADYLICADGGIRHIKKLGWKPNIIIGDFDSAESGLLEEFLRVGIAFKKYPEDKDRTDTQIAVDMAIEMGATQVSMLGAIGSRFDHSYANVMLLYRLAKKNIAAKIIHSHNVLTLSNSIIELDSNFGQFVSLLPFAGDAHILETQGLKYPIIDQLLPLNYPYGVSNMFISPQAIIKIKTGWVLAVVARD